MTRASLTEVLTPCLADGTAVAGLVVLGWEDALAYVQAAEAEGRPVILQAGPGCRRHTPLPVLGAMFRVLAESSSVPVVAHLDHGEGYDVCAEAIDCGFTSVMYDGSTLPLADNISRTARIAQMAHAAGVSVEAELGYVGYQGGASSHGTDPGQVAQFAQETCVDALAVSVGNRHLMTTQSEDIDLSLLEAIRAASPGLPLVLHGGSGIAIPLRHEIVRNSTVCKVNIGTELRMAFGQALRNAVLAHPDRFDRNAILSDTIPPVITAARLAIRSLCGETG
jgi:fructose-bisphosphate aldolase, class II